MLKTEVACVYKELIAGGQQNVAVVERNTAKATIDLSIGRAVPIHDLRPRGTLEVNLVIRFYRDLRCALPSLKHYERQAHTKRMNLGAFWLAPDRPARSH